MVFKYFLYIYLINCIINVKYSPYFWARPTFKMRNDPVVIKGSICC